ncbi:MAG: hypothetical protein K8Q89_11065 [Nitrosarchaeum sp.]|nr:hypothetical protein [Nitrosarchaeum sp.]
MNNNNMKNIKTIKTILFASLIAAMILPFAGMDLADAANDKIKENNKVANDKLSKKNVKC